MAGEGRKERRKDTARLCLASTGLHRTTPKTHLVPLALQQAHSYFYNLDLNRERTAREHFFFQWLSEKSRIRDPVNHTSPLFSVLSWQSDRFCRFPRTQTMTSLLLLDIHLSSSIAATMAASAARCTTRSAHKNKAQNK